MNDIRMVYMGTVYSEWNQHALSVRKGMIKTGEYCKGPVHWGGSLSCVEILVCIMERLVEEKKDGIGASELIISKGHAALVYYAVLAEYGLIPEDYYKEYQGNSSIYTEELTQNDTLGISCSTGSLGQGLPFALGRAIRAKLKGDNKSRIYCLVGDGEMDEGAVWEAVLLAAQLKADNLILLVDLNGLQSDGETENILSWRNLDAVLLAIGWEVHSIDGHDFMAIENAIQSNAVRPKAIMCKTVKGKGISFMENDPSWHDRYLRADELERAKKEVGLQ